MHSSVYRQHMSVLQNGFPPRSNPRNTIVYFNVSPKQSSHQKASSPNAIYPFVDNMVVNNEDVVYENIKPVFTILRFLGVLPISKPRPGVNQFKLVSPAMLYSAVVYLGLLTFLLYPSLHKVRILRTAEGKFEEAVIEYLFTVYLFPMCSIPILWYETKKIANILNDWVAFEVAYKKVTGTVLPVKLYNKALAIAFIIPIVSTTSVVITHVTMVHFKIIQIIPYVILEILTYILGGYWYLLCETLSVCANAIAEDFRQALKHIGPAGTVAKYRALWLQLSKLARETGFANCYTFSFVSLYLFFIITLSIYGLLSQIFQGFGIKDIGLALTACCSILLLFFICDEAHYASHNIRTHFQKKLLMAELSWMNTDAQTEVNMFLRATEMSPSNISLGGFLDVNRNLFKSLLATMVTYLVVLLQFQISIPEDSLLMPDAEDSIFNTTDFTNASPSTTIATMLTTLAKKKKKH